MDNVEKFGDWNLLLKLAEGGMAVTWLARAAGAEPGDEVAVKRIHPDLVRDPELRALFVEEARMARRVDHPNLVRTFVAGQVQGEDYLAMEYVWGEDLRRIAERGVAVGKPLPLRIAVRLIADAARGLHTFHELEDEGGLPLEPVHRDVSPPNLMLTFDGHTKVIDFGIAKVESRLRTVRQGQLKGKFSYMSPEQVQGLEVDRRSDIFALAVVLWEVTTMRRLFKAESDVLTIKLVSEARVMAPHVARHDYPPRLGEIVMKALARDPRQRHPTAAAFADELEGFLEETRIEPSRAQVAQYMQEIFPDRIEQLESLLGANYPGPSRTPHLPEIPDPSPEEAPTTAPAESLQPSGEGPTDSEELQLSGRRFEPGAESDAPAPPDEDDLDLMRQQRQSRLILGSFAMVALLVIAWIAYTIATHGAGTRVSDIEAVELFEAGELDRPDPPPVQMTPVSSEPEGARVILNGTMLVGRTPLEVPFVEGQPNDVGLVLDGHRGSRQVLPAEAAGTPLTVSLEPLQAPDGWSPPEAMDPAPDFPTSILRIRTTHGGQPLREASVSINGTPLEGTTPVTTSVPAGVPQHVTVRMQGFRDSTAWITPRESRREGQDDELLIELTSADQVHLFTSLRLQLNPQQARVTIGDEVTRGRNHQLRAPGHYPVLIEADGYLPWHGAFSTGPGTIFERVILDEIPREPALLSLRVDPDGTRLFAARVGDPVGASPIGTHIVRNHELSAGRWQLTFVHRDDEVSRRGRVYVELEGNTHLDLHYRLDDEGAELVREDSRPIGR